MRTALAAFSMTLPGTTDAVLLALPAAQHGSVDEIRIALDGEPVPWTMGETADGTRPLHFRAEAGTLDVEVRSRIDGRAAPSEDDPAPYLADSRYVEASALTDFVAERFGAATGMTAIDAMRGWIARSFTYQPELSELDDSALTSMRKLGGMCRDYAHVLIGLARAAGIPARYVSVYAPALVPPDFHAVVEVHVDGAWWLVDPTGLAPRGSMIRIATGMDALDTAWATTTGEPVVLRSLDVVAEDDALPDDAGDMPGERVQLG